MDPSTSFTFNWNSALGFCIVLLVGSLANSAGVGGGAIFIPILQALIGFDLKDSTAVSQALITAGAAVSVAINVLKPSPGIPDRCLIDFQLALALTPAVLLGVAIGVLLNVIFPSWLLTVLLLLLMVLLVLQSVTKGVHMWQQESKLKKQQQVQQQQLLAPHQGTSRAGHPRMETLGRLDSEAYTSLDCLEGDFRGPLQSDDSYPALLNAGTQADGISQRSLATGMNGLPKTTWTGRSALAHPGVIGSSITRGQLGAAAGAAAAAAGGASIRPRELGALQKLASASLACMEGVPEAADVAGDDLEHEEVHLLDATAGAVRPSSNGYSAAPIPTSELSLEQQQQQVEQEGLLATGRGGYAAPVRPRREEASESGEVSWFQRRSRWRNRFAQAFNELGQMDAHHHQENHHQAAPETPPPLSPVAAPVAENGLGAGRAPLALTGRTGRQLGAGLRIRRAVSLGGDPRGAYQPLISREELLHHHSRQGPLSPEDLQELLTIMEEPDGAGSSRAGSMVTWHHPHQQHHTVAATFPTRQASPFSTAAAPSTASHIVTAQQQPPGQQPGTRDAPPPAGAPRGDGAVPVDDVRLTMGGSQLTPSRRPSAGLVGSLAGPSPPGLISGRASHTGEGQLRGRLSSRSLGHAISQLLAGTTPAKQSSGSSPDVTLLAGDDAGEGLPVSSPGSDDSYSSEGGHRGASSGSTGLWHKLSSAVSRVPSTAGQLLLARWRYVVRGLGRVPRGRAGALVATWAACLLLQVLRSQTGTCSGPYWGLLGAQLTLLLLVSTSVVVVLERSRVGKSGDGSEEGRDVRNEGAGTGRSSPLGTSLKTMCGYLLLSVMAGLIGGLLGLGGGMVIGPLFLELGVQPQVGSATSSMMVLFSSSAALVQFVVLGRLNVEYSLVLGSASMMASVLGVVVVGDLVRRSGRTSLVVFSLATVMILGTLCVAVFGIMAMVRTLKGGGHIGLSPLCPT